MELHTRKAQNLIEYAIVVALVSAAVAAMSTYVFRSVQATQKAITDEFTNELWRRKCLSPSKAKVQSST